MHARRSFFAEAVVLLLVSVVLAAISNALAGPERKLRWAGTNTDADAPRPAAPTAVAASAPTPALPGAPGVDASFPPHPDKAWVEITGEDAVRLHEQKSVPFLDARRTSVYRQGHVPGARPFSVWEADVDDKVKALFAEGRDQAAPIVVYCSGGDCEDSHNLAEKLYRVGFDNVLVYKDGFPDWEKRNLPVTKGSEP
ncbi:MAG: rhodanese-like domain-containing protein [Thermoanaerobaculia bacterium]